MKMPFLEIKSLSFCYEDTVLLRDFSCSFFPGTLTVILGPSGAGKSTLLRIIAGLEKNFEGTVTRSVDVRYLPQDEVLLPWKTVQENILLPVKPSTREFDPEICPLLPLYPDQLSGGQKQMVAFQRHLLEEGDLLLLDEPFSNVDAYIRLKLLRRLQASIDSSKTAILVTHDFHDALKVADRIVLIGRGGIQSSWERSEFAVLDLESAMRSCYENY